MMIIPTTKTIATLPHLGTLLADHPGAVAGWGRKTSGRRAVWLSRLLRRPVVLLEDGFIRSVERRAPSLSLLVDDLGVYYDASQPSRMEREIARGADGDQGARAQLLMAAWRDGRVSKYNHAPDFAAPLPSRYVLVVDQIMGDLSVSAGLAQPQAFATMLAAALSENPDATVVVKIHPDVHSKAKQGYFAAETLSHPRIMVIGDDCHCADVIAGADSVYCVTSLMGFEAMLWGKPVRCFGMPFYAGWGLSHDEQRAPARRHPSASLADIAHAALVSVARYVDPQTGEGWQAEQAIAYVAQRRARLIGRGGVQGGA